MGRSSSSSRQTLVGQDGVRQDAVLEPLEPRDECFARDLRDVWMQSGHSGE